MKPWYEKSFGQDYMLVYKHRDWENANKEVQQMARWLNLPRGSQVLDVGCGMGRHALALSEEGYQVTGMDLSETLLQEAMLNDAQHSVAWEHGDMRELPFDTGSFDATVNLFTSFGYFAIEEDHIRVLRQLRRVLRKDGVFLIDFLNPEFIIRNLVPRSVRMDEECGLRIEEQRTIQDGYVYKTITISKKSQPNEESRQYVERVQLLSLDWFKRHLNEAGLVIEQLYGHYDGSAYDEVSSPRMIMVGVVK